MTYQPKSRERLQREADKRAQVLTGVFDELSGLPPSAAAQKLNERGVKAPAGGKWYAIQVVRLRKRLKAAQ